MKILALRFKNINSFRGSHEVDFSRAPLENAGLFAITGPTGSGKTTLLDVIALALYNRIPRIDERISKNFIARSGSVITRNTTSAYAEVEYQAHSGRYLSRWQIETARTGNLKDYEMEIHALDKGEILDVKKSLVPEENEKLIGLSYDQFMRSMLLAQGEFAKFLKASKEERGKLLEKITGSWIYREIGKRVYDKHAIFKKRVEKYANQEEHLLAEQAAAPPLDELKEELKTNRLHINRQEVLVNDCQEKYNQKTAYNELLQQHDKARKSLTQAEELARLFWDSEGAKLKQHEHLLPYQEQLLQWQQAEQQLVQVKKQLTQWQERKSSADMLYDKVRGEVANFIGNNVWEDESGESRIYTMQQRVDEQLNALDDVLSAYGELTAGARHLKSAPGFEVDFNHPIIAREHVMQKQKQDQETVDMLTADLAEILTDTPKQLLADIELVHGKILQLKQLEKEQTARQERLKVLEEKIAEQLGEQKTSGAEIQLLEKEWEVVNGKVETLDAKWQLSKLQASLEEHRSQLKPGEPCPLCGALEHPWAGTKPAPPSELEKQLKTARKQEKERNGVLITKQKDKAALDKLLIQNQQQKDTLFSEIATRDNEMKSLANELPERYRAKTPEDLAKIKKKLTAYTEINDRLMACSELLDLLDAMAQKQEDGKAARARLVELYPPAGEQRKGIRQAFNQAVRDLLKSWQESLQKLQLLAQQFESLVHEKDAAENIMHKVTETLSEPLAQLGYPEIRQAQATLLSGARYQQLQQQRQNVEQQVTEKRSALRHIDEAIAKMKQAADLPDAEKLAQELVLLKETWQNLQKTGEALSNKCYSVEARNKELLQIREKMSQERDDASVWRLLDTYIGDAQGKKFSTFAQQLTMKQLIGLANKRLQTLSERYRLDMPDIAVEDDSIVVLDYDMGGIRRSVKTLSGGESFLVSLSLALGLSDLASRDIRINSLFIDEGFGTLDPQTLDQTLDTLEKLQAESNKTIGIISHVEALKDRISTQIVMHRNGQGYSKLQVVTPK